MKKILQKEDKVLRLIAKEVALTEIKTPKIKKVLREMYESLKKEKDGVAIAAPQIGYSLRIFVVSARIFDKNFIREGIENNEDRTIEVKEDVVFINPKISKLSKD